MDKNIQFLNCLDDLLSWCCKLKLCIFYTVLQSSTYLLNTSLTDELFFHTRRFDDRSQKLFFCTRRLLGVTHLSKFLECIYVIVITKNVTYSEKEKNEKCQKYNNTSLLCFIILRCPKLAKRKDRWTLCHWKKNSMCGEEDTSPTTAFFINMQSTSCENWVNAWNDSKHSKEKKEKPTFS